MAKYRQGDDRMTGQNGNMDGKRQTPDGEVGL